jgi:hypothetical protein
LLTGTINSIEMKETAKPQNIAPIAENTPFFKKEGDGNGILMMSALTPFFTALGVQAKYMLDQPGDPLELQADHIADQVMRMPQPQLKASDKELPAGEEGELVQGKTLTHHISPFVQRQEMLEEEENLQARDLNSVQRKCEGCDKELEGDLQAKLSNNLQRKCTDCENEEKKTLQAKSKINRKSNVKQNIAAKIDSVTRGGGHALSRSALDFFEPRFGFDFNDVRVHSGAQAADSARDLNAQAYTVGKNIVFGSGQYAPEEQSGKKLIAHELTHVVQQMGKGGKKLNRSKSKKKLHADSSQKSKHVQRKRMQIGNVDADFQPRAVLETAYQAPGGRITAKRGIGVNHNGHGIAQLDRKEEAVGLNITYKIEWQTSNRQKPLPTALPAELITFCNPCLILEGDIVQNMLKWANPTIRDMTKDCRNRKTFSERKQFVETFLNIITRDECLLIEESPLKIPFNDVPVIGPLIGIFLPKKEIGLLEFCRLKGYIPVVSEIDKIIKDGIIFMRDAIMKLPTDPFCKHVPIIDPPDPARPTAKGTATIVYNTRFYPENGLNGYGPWPITQQSGSGARIEQPVASGRNKIGDRGVNISLAPALLLLDTNDRGQALADIDVLLAASPTPVQYNCEAQFFPFRIDSDRFEDENSQLQAIHLWFHGLHPRTKDDLHEGKGEIKVFGRASQTGSFEHNMGLSKRRGNRVALELNTAAGSGSKLQSTGTGYLAAQEPGESARERRADVRATGRLEGDAALEVETPEGACFGGSVADTLPKADEPEWFGEF